MAPWRLCTVKLVIKGLIYIEYLYYDVTYMASWSLYWLYTQRLKLININRVYKQNTNLDYDIAFQDLQHNKLNHNFDQHQRSARHFFKTQSLDL